MSDSKITIIGLYKWKSYENGDLFELMNLPEGIDKDTVVANILEKSSEFEVMYPDAEYVHDSIMFWSKKWFWTFNKWIKAITINYEPLYNYDRTEEWTDNNTHSDDDTINSIRKILNNASNDGSKSGTETNTENGSGTYSENGSVSTDEGINRETIINANGTSNTEVTKSAFDSSGYSPYEKTGTATTDDSTTHESSQRTTNTVNTSSSDSSDSRTSNSSTSESFHDKHSASGSDDYDESKKNEGKFETVHKGRMWGNIGVTTSQQMLQSELDVAMFNLYDRIADIFIQEYCIPVYI